MEIRRLLVAALSCAAMGVPQILSAAESWGGSVGLTSDYLVRGITKSGNDAALQADLHVAFDFGVFGGVFASSAQPDPGEPRSAELSAFVGYSRDFGSAWRAKVLASYYSYVPSRDSSYNYAELAIEAEYDSWLDLGWVHSVQSSLYIPGRGLTGFSSDSVETTVRTPWRRHLAAVAGVGYTRYAGTGGGDYAYWSAGGVLDLAPCTFSLAYVNTSAGAAQLFYSAAAHDRWIATAIWRF